MENISLYQRILESNLINFIIMVSILILIFKKANLGSIIDKMASDIKEKVMTSASAAQDALSEYKKTKKSIKTLDSDKEKIIEQAKENINSIKQKTSNDISTEEKSLDIKLHKNIETLERKTKDNTVDEVFNAVIDEAQNVIIKNLDDETQKSLIEKCIIEIDAMGEIKL